MNKNMNALLLTDGYKTGHHRQYPVGTQFVYSNWTPRSNTHAPDGCDKVVSFGQQYLVRWLHDQFNENFFLRDKDEVCGELALELSMYLGSDYDVSHFEALHDLGYLPIMVKSLPEGIEVPMRIPMLTIVNTIPDFYWVTNYLETILSNTLWQPMTSATIALRYKRIFKKWALLTDRENVSFIDFQGHDFSMRGMGGLSSTIGSGMGHAAVFMGSDSLPVIHSMRKYYDAFGFVIGSVNATEHSVMCAGTKDDEIKTFRNLMAEFPTGILSIVSDTWDLWKVLTEYLPELKEEILARDGKIVIRPDSGDPVDIICGTGDSKFEDLSKWITEDPLENPSFFKVYLIEFVRNNTPHGERGVSEHTGFHRVNDKHYKATIHNISWNRFDKQYYFIEMWEDAKITVEEIKSLPQHKGVIELLWDVFGGTVNDQGFKVLDPHIGAIYGDAITTERADEILRRLHERGFASTNVVLGIGSFTYQYKTRDTFGFAMKATSVVVNGVITPIFKDPVTDNGVKKSAKGLLRVEKSGNDFVLFDNVTQDAEYGGELKPIYIDGCFSIANSVDLNAIRHRINECT